MEYTDENIDHNREPEPSPDEQTSSAGEYAAFAVKAVAVCLSLVILLTCILAVALPLSSMRVFNALGMDSRAVDFGERYISGELKSRGAEKPAEDGYYSKLAVTPELGAGDFDEALYVVIHLSYDLMENAYSRGDIGVGSYYAERVEKYTRMYLSLADITALNDKRSAQAVSSMPMQALRSVVYSYGSSMRAMNYRASARLGKTEAMLFNPRNPQMSCVASLDTLSNTFGGRDTDVESAKPELLDDFCDYINQLGEYLDVEFIRAGVENDITAKGKVDGKEIDILSDTYIINNYANKLDGDEFGLFITKTEGFGKVYTQLLNNFVKYAQYAADYRPSDASGNKRGEQLRQLYWLRSIGTAARRMWYMEKLLYQSKDKFGAAKDDINKNYENWSACQSIVDPDGNGIATKEITAVYADKLKVYISDSQS